MVEHVRDAAQIVIDLIGGLGRLGASTIWWRWASAPSRWCSRPARPNAPGMGTQLPQQRAEMRWKLREALDPHSGPGIALPPDKRLAAQLAAPTWRLRGNAIVIESKADIYKRLGTSTDDATAVILAWHKRDEALRRQSGKRLIGGGGLRVFMAGVDGVKVRRSKVVLPAIWRALRPVDDVGLREVLPLEQKRLTTGPRQRVGKAVAIVQRGGVTPLAVATPGASRRVRLLSIDRNNLGANLEQPEIKLAPARVT